MQESPLRPALAAAVLLVILLSIAGCAKTSPAIGTWTGSVGPVTASMTLNPDGTGTVAIPPYLPQQSVSWKEEEKQVSIQMGNVPRPGGTGGTGGTAAAPAPGGGGGASVNLTGTIAEDGKTMTVPIANISLTLNKQETAK